MFFLTDGTPTAGELDPARILQRLPGQNASHTRIFVLGLGHDVNAHLLDGLADAFGGAFIHCCGPFEQHLPALAASGVRFRGFDYCEPFTRTEAVYEALGPELVYNVALFEARSPVRGGMPGFIRQHLRQVAPPDMRFWFCTSQAQSEVRAAVRECLQGGG